MRAARLYGSRDLRIEDIDRPTPARGEVLLEVEAVGICGSDLHYYLEGGISDAAIDEPLIMGHEFCGRVVAAGLEDVGLKAGQRVVAEPAISCGMCEWCQEGDPNLCPYVQFAGSPGVDGALREYMAHPSRSLFPVPDDWSPAVCALIEPLGVAVHALDLCKMRIGSTCAVIGCGPLGLIIIQLLRAAGAAEVFASDPVEHRREAALASGADHGFDPESVHVAEEVARLTSGRGVDCAFEVTNNSAAAVDAVGSLRRGGRLIMVGIPDDDVVHIQASALRRRGVTMKMVRRMKHTIPRAIKLVERGMVDLDSLITHRFSLDEVDEAFRLHEGYQDGVVKALVEVRGGREKGRGE